MRPLAAAVAAVVLVALGAGMAWPILPPAVSVTRPHRGDAVEMAYATGFVEPSHPVAVSARLTAPVSAVLVDEGDPVRKGQPLLRLDDSDLRGALAQARAASVGATLAERRTTALFAQGWATRAARDAAVANGEAARAAEAMAAAKLGQNVVRSGISGIVIKRDVEPGELATPSRTLMLLGDPRRSRITATVDERDVPQLRLGQEAFVSSDAWPGHVFRAHVAELTPTGDPEQRAFRARLLLDEGVVLPLGMSLEVNVVTNAAHNATLVPNAALAGDKVWTVVNGRAHAWPIRVGIRGRDSSQIWGLPDDAAVILSSPPRLHEGQRVAAKQ